MKHFYSAFLLLILLSYSHRANAQEPGRSDTIDVLHYDIHLNIKDFTNKTIDGYTTITTTFKQANITQVRFDLLSLSVDSVHVNNNIHYNYNYNDTLITITLPAAVSQQDTLAFTIFYHGLPVLDPSTWGGFYYTGNTAYNLGVGFESLPHNFGRVWFPCVDEFRDKALYDMYITTLETQMAVSGGTLMGSINNTDNTKTWHWKMHTVIPTYLASVAVGDYKAVNIPLIHNTDTTQTYIYVNPADTTKAQNSFIHLNQIFNTFVDRWGPYMWERVGYVGVAFNNGAMEHATNIAYPASLIDGTLTAESLFAHELAHSWFGNLITCSTAEDMWINEGWARYSEAIFMETLYPNINPILDGYKTEIRDLQYKTFRKAYGDDGGHFALYPMPQNITYNTTTYDKGALIVHTLRHYMGDDLFFNSVKQVLQEFAFKNINSAQLCDRLSHYSGINLHDFFDAWVYQPGYLHFSIDSLVQSQSQSTNYTYYIHQKHSLGLNIGETNRLEVTFFDQNWNNFTDTIRFSGEYGSKSITLPFTPVYYTVDFHEKMSDAIVDYNLNLKTTGNNSCTHAFANVNVITISDSAFIRVEHHWAQPDPLSQPKPAIQRISPNRYWRIDGIAPSTFHARVNLNFNSAADLDGPLMNGYGSDSLVLLYRKNASENWQMTPFTKIGSNVGIIKIDTLKLGEYTLAIGDKTQIGIDEAQIISHPFNIHPNPNSGTFNLSSQDNNIDYYEVYDLMGKNIITIFENDKNTHSIALSTGTFLIKAFDKEGKLIQTQKMIITNK